MGCVLGHLGVGGKRGVLEAGLILGGAGLHRSGAVLWLIERIFHCWAIVCVRVIPTGRAAAPDRSVLQRRQAVPCRPVVSRPTAIKHGGL